MCITCKVKLISKIFIGVIEDMVIIDISKNLFGEY